MTNTYQPYDPAVAQSVLLTAQQIFDKVAAHLAAQATTSMDENEAQRVGSALWAV